MRSMVDVHLKLNQIFLEVVVDLLCRDGQVKRGTYKLKTEILGSDSIYIDV